MTRAPCRPAILSVVACPRPIVAVRFICSLIATLRAAQRNVLRAHGFTTDQLVDLVRYGLASATPTRMRAGRDVIEVVTLRISEIEVVTLRISEKGRQALAKQ